MISHSVQLPVQSIVMASLVSSALAPVSAGNVTICIGTSDRQLASTQPVRNVQMEKSISSLYCSLLLSLYNNVIKLSRIINLEYFIIGHQTFLQRTLYRNELHFVLKGSCPKMPQINQLSVSRGHLCQTWGDGKPSLRLQFGHILFC